MNIVFGLMLISSLIMMTISSPEGLFASMINGATNGITLSVKLLAIYIIWLSILNIMERIGLDKVVHRAMRPITRRLFKGEDDKTHELISMNFSTNLLGMGSAATPLGIRAMERMCKDRSVAPHNAVLFAVINATSIQLLPTTIIGLRSSAGSASASDIIIPSLIATTIATIVGVLLCKVFVRRD